MRRYSEDYGAKDKRFICILSVIISPSAALDGDMMVVHSPWRRTHVETIISVAITDIKSQFRVQSFSYIKHKCVWPEFQIVKFHSSLDSLSTFICGTRSHWRFGGSVSGLPSVSHVHDMVRRTSVCIAVSLVIWDTCVSADKNRTTS